MILFLTYDANEEAGLDSVLDNWDDDCVAEYFEDKDYGSELQDVSMFLMCRDPKLNFQQRIRFSKKEHRLYVDIMLDLNVLQRLTDIERKKLVADKIVSEIPKIIRDQKFKDFDLAVFEKDLIGCLRSKGWLTALVN